MEIKKVLIVFKTHLDIGFTDFASVVKQKYFDVFIPNALKTARELKERNADASFKWTTGSWLIAEYLRTYAGSEKAEALFEETRKSGVRIITIHPDLTDTNLYRNADFRPADDPACVLTAEEVAEAVLGAVRTRDGLVVSDITLRPQKNRIVRNPAE